MIAALPSEGNLRLQGGFRPLPGRMGMTVQRHRLAALIACSLGCVNPAALVGGRDSRGTASPCREQGRTLGFPSAAPPLQIFGEAGYDFAMGKAALTPFARLAHVRTKSDAFAEAGGNAALAIAGAKQETTFLSLGARARFNIGQPGFQPYVSAAWNRASGDRGAPVGAAFASGGGSPFVLTGTLIPKNSAEIEAGFDYTSGPFRIGAAYSGTLASDRRTHGARVTASFAF